MDSESSRRDFTRVNVCFEVEIVTLGGQTLRYTTRDISAAGLHVESEEELPLGERCEATIRLHNGELLLELPSFGNVVRQTAGGFALELDDIPEETGAHLRQLLLHNARDAVSVECELTPRRTA